MCPQRGRITFINVRKFWGKTKEEYFRIVKLRKKKGGEGEKW